MLWRCKSRLFCGQECQQNCEVDVDFEPKACLKNATFQDWEADKLEAAAEKAKLYGRKEDLDEYLKLRRQTL